MMPPPEITITQVANGFTVVNEDERVYVFKTLTELIGFIAQTYEEPEE